jgi:tRNA nucleotidyltransferase (CCA-adding enzyme)
MTIKIPNKAKTIITLLENAGFEAFCVGGAVRDSIMGLNPTDWDITTSASPEDTVRIFKDYKTVDTGLKHGTLTVIIDKTPFEVTTYRVDGDYNDNRHPENVHFTKNLKDDLSRRDFTVNAIAYSPLSGFVDPYGGKEDIDKKTIRCVGNPNKRFGEDALRILRALRFSSVLGFEIEKETADSIHRCKHLLANISAERIFVEVSKMLCGKDIKRILTDFSDVIFFIFPELEPMNFCNQNHERHIYNVWGHTVAAVDAVRNEPHLRFAMLLHDSGKPHVKTSDENGTDHFYSHAKKSREIADKILLRLKTSNSFRKKVCDLTEFHDFLPDKISTKTYKRYIAKLGFETIRELFEIREADIRSQNPIFINEGLAANEIGLKVLEEIEAENACFRISDLAISGKDLAAAGIPPSPLMGRILEALLDEVMGDKLENRKDTLLNRANEINKTMHGS